MQMTLPGMGQPVSAADVDLWLRIVARIDPDGPRAAAYIRGYQVAAKIAAAKDAGTWPPTGGYIE